MIETLTSLPTGRINQQQQSTIRHSHRRRDRGISISSNNSEGGVKAGEEEGKGKDGTKKEVASSAGKSSSSSTTINNNSITADFCGVVSLLECVTGGGAQPDRTTKRALRSKHREFNTRAQVAWGRSTKKKGGKSTATATTTTTTTTTTPRRCYQPRHLPLPLSPNTRVSFAYELTSIAILVDASPSLTSTFGMNDHFEGIVGEEKTMSGSSSISMNDNYCVPLDRLGPLIKRYLQGLVHPIDVPPVSVSGLGVAFGRWKPNLAVTVVAVYPPTLTGENASAGLLVRDFRVSDEVSALELAQRIERWALREVEGVIAERLCGDIKRDISGGDNSQYIPSMSALGSFSLPSIQQLTGPRTSVMSSMKDMLAVGDAALATLPPEGRPLLLVATDCCNIHGGGVYESLSETTRTDVPISVLDLSASSSALPNTTSQERLSLSMSNDSQSLKDTCNISGGVFLNSTRLDSYLKTTAGSSTAGSTIDYHFSFKKRSIKPNQLQWYTLFILSPFTPGGHHASLLRPMNIVGSNGLVQYRASSSISLANPKSTPTIYDSRTSAPGATGVDTSHQSQERIVLTRYNVQPIRIKSLLVTRVLEGYRARRYGANTIDSDKVSVHLVMPLYTGIALHYEVAFVSSPYHIPTIGQAHIKLEISGSNTDFIQTVKKLFNSHGLENIILQGKRRVISASSKAAAEKICKLLRWTRKEDYLDSYLCSPG